MKKLIALFFISIVVVSSAFGKDLSKTLTKAPELDVEGAYIVDLREYKNAEDNFAFVNRTQTEKLLCDIYYVSPRTIQWVKSDSIATLNGYGDRDIVQPDDKIDLDDVTFVAYKIYPKDEYTVEYKVKNSDLYVIIGKSEN